MVVTLEDGAGNYVSVDFITEHNMHLYYDCDGRKFELVGPTAKLLDHLKFALNALDPKTVKTI